MRNTINRSATGATAFEAAGEVQEKPAAARVGVKDADCLRGSEDCALRPWSVDQWLGYRQAAHKPSVAPKLTGSETTPGDKGTLDSKLEEL